MSRTLTLLAVFLVTVSDAAPATGRPQAGRGTQALDPVPLVAEALGLKMSVPAGAVITTAESVLFEWSEVAGTPEFKQISKLVTGR